MILLIDNYDSFTYNLARYLQRLGVETEVIRNDCAGLDAALTRSIGIILSPGPCGPLQAGRCVEVVKAFSGDKPILGICLGHQVIGHAFGGQVVRAHRPIHGQAFPMTLDPIELFFQIPSGSKFARYHSLIVDWQSLPDCLEVIGFCNTPSVNYSEATVREVMAIRHREHPTFGVQFHPESVLSRDGYRLLANFLRICGLSSIEHLPENDFSGVGQNATESVQELVSEHTAVLPQYSSSYRGE